MTNAPAPFVTVERARQLADTLLDRAYVKVTAPVIQAIVDSPTSRLISRRLDELEAEIARLAAEESTLDADNAVLVAFRTDLDTWLRRIAALIDANAPAIQRTGIDAGAAIARQLALPGVSDQQVSQIGWTTPSGDQIEEAIDYTAGTKWQDALKMFEEGVAAIILAAIARDMADDAAGMVATLRSLIDSVPRFKADSLMRTLQLESDRAATAMVGLANADLIEVQIRVAVLDASTCLACIALHGTEVPLDGEIEEHDNGRCRGVFVIKGRNYLIQPGQDYFDNLSDSQKANLMGYANYQAYQAGKVNLQDFVHRYTDPLYGDMLRQASLKGLLGDQAQNYYRNKPKGTN